MSYYRPNNVPSGDIEVLKRFLFDELDRISRCMAEKDEKLSLMTRNVEPPKYAEGDIVLCDGSNWNPGSGAGVYRRSVSAWVFLG